MKIEFKSKLLEEANKIGINLDEKMLEKFEIYKELLLEWNEKINLTRVTEEYEIIMKHFIDSLECVKYIKHNDKIIDVGTGAGFPGIVIAIFFGGKVEITLLDALNKRIDFLNDVVKKIELKNVNLIHGRAEELGQNMQYRETYDITVSRAVANLPVLLELDTPFIKVGGKCLLMKGENINDEINNSNNALKVLNCDIANKIKYKYCVGDELYTRYILEVKKIKNTPKNYPRIYGKIKKNTL